MGKFEQEAKDLLAAIGGKENVTAVTHCATRMRFVLGDDKKADVKTIEAIPAVKGTFTNAGQFQVIIGNDVPIFYNDFTAVSGIEGVSKEAAKSAAKSNQNPVQRVMTTLAEIFTPIIPALIVGGLILGFRNVLEGVHWSMLDGKTITEVSQFWSGVMGQGVVIEPSQGELVSPVNGTVTVLFPTKHAVGIVSEEGIEMLMHIGMNTVSLDGKGFVAHVEQGDKVVVGQQLISFDMDVIKKAGLVTETPVIITNQDDFQADVEGNLPRDIKRGDALMIAHRTK